MRTLVTIVSFLWLAPLGLAQLSQEQKLSDFMQLAGLYAKHYGPYEEKRDVFNFDLYKIQPWLTEIQQSGSDIDFYDICARYVASLQDSHDEFTIESDYDAWLHFNGDIYDGKFLVDYVDRFYLPRSIYGFGIGDQLVSVDGVSVSDLLTKFAPYAVNAASNPVSRARIAAGTITERYQGWYPRAADIGENATIVVKQQGGETATYTIPWDAIGTPVTAASTVPSPRVTNSSSVSRRTQIGRRGVETSREQGTPGRSLSPWGVRTSVRSPRLEDPESGYMAPLKQLRNMRGLRTPFVTGGLYPFENPFPAFDPPDGFELRLGFGLDDEFLSGTLPAGNKKIGFIRIPWMDPASGTPNALKQFAAEIAYFQANTDALIVDTMANGGGDGCYSQDLASYLIPHSFRGVQFKLRATHRWQYFFSRALTAAEFEGAPQWVIDLYSAHLDVVKKALSENRGLTGSIAACGPSFDTPPATDDSGRVVAYTKPILVLVDNFTLSAAEIFVMLLQDEKRATIFGTRTNGGGGSVRSFTAGAYSEAFTRVTDSLITRSKAVQTPGFPPLTSYDGVGIFPDIQADYMTLGNLETGGQPFITSAMTAISGLIKATGK